MGFHPNDNPIVTRNSIFPMKIIKRTSWQYKIRNRWEEKGFVWSFSLLPTHQQPASLAGHYIDKWVDARNMLLRLILRMWECAGRILALCSKRWECDGKQRECSPGWDCPHCNTSTHTTSCIYHLCPNHLVIYRQASSTYTQTDAYKALKTVKPLGCLL